MNSNLVICRNEVYIEDVYVGEFQSFELKSDHRTLGASGVLVLPLYAIGMSQEGEARLRVRSIFKPNVIRPCAEVKVYCWYEGLEKELIFSGFIEHIVEGFPTKIFVQDNTFILRFGSIQRGWTENATLDKIVKDCIPVADEGFKNERERQGLTRAIPSLTYTADTRNVQAITTAMSFRNWGARSPFDTIQKIIQLLVLYGGVTDDYNVFVGANVNDTSRTPVELDTRRNVIGRDIVPIDGRFVDYDVKITGILSNGKQYTATAGYGTSRSKEQQTLFGKTHGESFRGYSTLTTPKGIQDFADRQLEMLRGFRNKGKINLLLYPKLQLLDQVQFTDSLFPELSALYYVTGYEFKADESGYFQKLDVTDQIFAI